MKMTKYKTKTHVDDKSTLTQQVKTKKFKVM